MSRFSFHRGIDRLAKSFAPRAFPSRAACALTTLAFVAAALPANAADYFRRGAMTFNSNTWNQTSWWSTSVDGTAISSFDTSGHYFNDDRELRTGQGTDLTFLGASLTLAGGSISLRRGETTYGASTVPHLIVSAAGSRVTNDIGGAARLHANTLTLNGALSTGPQANTRVIWLTADVVTGTGNITNSQGTGAHGTRVGFTDATAWTGNIVHTWGTLDFSANLVSGGGLVVDTTLSPTVNLTHSLTFTSVSIGGTQLDPGLYSFEWLQTNYGSVFGTGDSGAYISVVAVPEPASFAALTGAAGVLVVGLRRRRRA